MKPDETAFLAALDPGPDLDLVCIGALADRLEESGDPLAAGYRLLWDHRLRPRHYFLGYPWTWWRCPHDSWCKLPHELPKSAFALLHENATLVVRSNPGPGRPPVLPHFNYVDYLFAADAFAAAARALTYCEAGDR